MCCLPQGAVESEGKTDLRTRIDHGPTLKEPALVRVTAKPYLKSAGGVERPPVFEPQQANEPSSLMPHVLVLPPAIC